MADPTPGTASVIDRRPHPRGVLPRGVQTSLMAGLAIGVLAIILFTSQSSPPSRAASPSNQPAQAPSPDRLRDYQDRLRAVDERARQQQAARDPDPVPAPRFVSERPPPPAPAPDSLNADRKRREYESLFAGNVVLSRRPDDQRLKTASNDGADSAARESARTADTPSPSLDDVVDAVMRAASRNGTPTIPSGTIAPPPTGNVTAAPSRPGTDPSAAAEGPVHRVFEGTVIDTVLTNRLDGTMAAPVNCLVTNAVYSSNGQYVLIPSGTRVLGTTKPVQAFGETRLAVAFHRIVLPNGRAYPLEQFMGLNAIGDAGLRDQVNQHYASMFGASAAVGLISGFAQFLGSGLNRDPRGGTVIVAGNVGDTTAQATSQTMNRFLNRLPTVTIREGHRVKVYLTGDLDLPAYQVEAARR